MLCAMPERAELRPMRVMACLNFSRASAMSMASREAPIISTPYFSSTPCLARSSAQFSPVCPPMVGSSASGRSLARHGVLEKYGVEMIGASREAIDKAEDREKFKQAMKSIGLNCPRSMPAHSLEEALQVQAAIGYPVVVRPSFTLGGSGGGIAYNREEFVAICERGLDASPTQELLIEESVIGWKEFEMEVVRDRMDNCIIVCSIENI